MLSKPRRTDHHHYRICIITRKTRKTRQIVVRPNGTKGTTNNRKGARSRIFDPLRATREEERERKWDAAEERKTEGRRYSRTRLLQRDHPGSTTRGNARAQTAVLNRGRRSHRCDGSLPFGVSCAGVRHGTLLR